MRRLFLLVVVLSTTLLTAPLPASTSPSCDSPTSSGTDSEILICHSGESVWLGGKWQKLQDGMTIRVPAGKTSIVVEETNTAMYDYKVGSEALEVPEAKALATFLKEFGPYLVDLPATVFRAKAEARLKNILADEEQELRDLRAQLEELDDHLLRLEALELLVATTYRLMASNELKPVGAGAYIETDRAYKDIYRHGVLTTISELEKTYGEIIRLLSKDPDVQAGPDVSDKIREALEEVNPITDDEAQKDLITAYGLTPPPQPPPSNGPDEEAAISPEMIDNLTTSIQADVQSKLEQVRTQARKALKESDGVLSYAFGLDDLIQAARHAEDRWETARPLSITPQTGRTVSLKITKKSNTVVDRAATQKEIDLKLKVLPIWKIKPTVGLSLLYADGATFPQFATKKVTVEEDGAEVERFEIQEGDVEDERFTYQPVVKVLPPLELSTRSG